MGEGDGVSVDTVACLLLSNDCSRSSVLSSAAMCSELIARAGASEHLELKLKVP